jgi:hypothetical protein
MGSVEGKCVALERGGNRGGGDWGKGSSRERSGGARFVSLSFLVFLVLGDDVVLGGEGRERRAAERHDGGEIRRVDATPFLSWSRWPNAVEREGGGNLRTRMEVTRGIPRIYPRERARRKEEREGEPKQRCR